MEELADVLAGPVLMLDFATFEAVEEVVLVDFEQPVLFTGGVTITQQTALKPDFARFEGDHRVLQVIGSARHRGHDRGQPDHGRYGHDTDGTRWVP